MPHKKNTQVEVLPVVDLSKKIGVFFFVGGAAQVKQTREQGTMSEATRSTILLPITKQ